MPGRGADARDCRSGRPVALGVPSLDRRSASTQRPRLRAHPPGPRAAASVSGPCIPRPPATMMSARERSTPSRTVGRRSTTWAAWAYPGTIASTRSTRPAPGSGTSGSSRTPRRNTQIRTSLVQATSTAVVSLSARRRPTSRPSTTSMSWRSQSTPASSLTARDAASSAAAPEFSSMTVEIPRFCTTVSTTDA